MNKCSQPSGEELHLLILMCLCDFVASTLLATMVQKVTIVCYIYPLEVEATLVSCAGSLAAAVVYLKIID